MNHCGLVYLLNEETLYIQLVPEQNYSVGHIKTTYFCLESVRAMSIKILLFYSTYIFVIEPWHNYS